MPRLRPPLLALFQTWLLAGLLLLAVPGRADELIKPYHFTAGSPATAAEVNADFDALYDRVNALQVALDALQVRVDALDGETEVQVLFATNFGNFTVALDAERAPVSVANFLAYVDGPEQFFNGKLFHRVIPGFVAQGGGTADNVNFPVPPYPPIINEALNGLRNERGTIAMARTSAIDSATSQFYINLEENRFLDALYSPVNVQVGVDQSQQLVYDWVSGYGYAVFGRVIAGMDVIDAIAAVGSQNGTTSTPVILNSVTRVP